MTAATTTPMVSFILTDCICIWQHISHSFEFNNKFIYFFPSKWRTSFFHSIFHSPRHPIISSVINIFRFLFCEMKKFSFSFFFLVFFIINKYPSPLKGNCHCHSEISTSPRDRSRFECRE